MDFVEEIGKTVEIRQGFEEEEWESLSEVLLKSARKFVEIVQEDENLKRSSKSIGKAIKTHRDFISEEHNNKHEEITELKDKRDLLRNKLKDMRNEAERTNREMQEVTCAVRACALLTNTKLVCIQNQIVGKMLNDSTGKSKYFEYPSQDPELTNKLWIDVERLSTND